MNSNKVTPKTVKIHSENDIFQILLSLKENRQKRQKEKKFIFEGVRNINNAIQSDWKIESLVYSPEMNLSRWASGVLQKSRANFHYEIPLDLLEKLSDKKDVSELIAVAHMRGDNLQNIPVSKNFLAVVFDRPSSHGNLGTLIRSCDSFGVSGLVITGHAVDLYDPETIRATTGSFFTFPSIRLPSHNELILWIESLKKDMPDLQIIATDEAGDENIFDRDFGKPTIILVGNEKAGLSAAYKEMADVIVKIPMRGSASSLNVACATSIILYEINRQRKR